MKLNTLRKTIIVPALLACTVPAMISCAGSNKSDSAEANKVETEAPSDHGKGGGPKLGMPGFGGPAIDKSGDSTLQAMIKDVVPKFKQLQYTDSESGKTMSYNLFEPANVDASKQYPLVMFIADASTPGDNVTLPLTQGYGALVWATEEWQSEHPCYVLVPQFTGVAVDDEYQHTDEVDIAMRLLENVAGSHNVDKSRLYSTGQSMGGMISMYYDVAYPDVFAASIFVDSHWDTATFPELVKHKFVYFIAGESGKSYADLKPLEEAAEKGDVSYTFAAWDAKLPEARQSELAGVMLQKGAPVNIFEFEPNTVLPADGKGSEHMYSFDYAYRIPSVREWMFAQSKSLK